MVQCHVGLDKIFSQLSKLLLDVIGSGSLCCRLSLVMQVQVLCLSKLLLESGLVLLEEGNILFSIL